MARSSKITKICVLKAQAVITLPCRIAKPQGLGLCPLATVVDTNHDMVIEFYSPLKIGF
jgi:hypothetical protein